MSITYTCLIIDDEPLAQELIEEHVSKIPELKVLGRCNNALEASSILAKERVDLLFLDINMPVMKGIDFFRNLVTKPQVIFTTAYREYALEGFEVSALDYLLKPIVFDRFFLAIQKFFKEMEKSSQPGLDKRKELPERKTVFVHQGHKKIKVYLDEVIYVESFKDYIEIHTVSRHIRVKENIGVFEKRLGIGFLRIHRSYVIDPVRITGYSKNEVEIDEIELPIGSSYRTKVFDFLEGKIL